MKRTIETASILNSNTSSIFDKTISSKILDEINIGNRDGMTYEEWKKNYPDEFEEREKDKHNYRFPRGESYADVIKRIEPMIFEIEREKQPIVIIGHQAMLRCLYGYFSNIPIENLATLEIPLHQVIKFTPQVNGYKEERFEINPISKEFYGIEVNQEFEQSKFFSLYNAF